MRTESRMAELSIKARQTASDTKSGAAKIQKLMEQYRKAKVEQRTKEQASRDAATRTIRLRLDIEAAIQAGKVDVFRAIYAVDPAEGKRAQPKLVASGRNKHLVDLISVVGAINASHGGSQTPACDSACDDAMNETDSQDMACICDCLELGSAGPMTVVTCIPITGKFPDPDPDLNP